MNICMFSRVVIGHSKGGVQDHIAMLTEGLAKRGHKVTIITSGNPGKDFEEKNGVKIYYLKNTKRGNYSKGYFKKGNELFLELHKKEPFDVVHSQDVSAYYFVKKNLHRRLGIPVVVTMHGTAYDEFRTRINNLSIAEPVVSLREMAIFLIFVYRYFLRELPTNKRVNAMIATSNEQFELYKKAYRINKNKISIVYNGIDSDFFRPKRIDKPESPRILLCIARFEKEKGIQNILRAMPLILRQQDVRLWLIGDGYYKNKLKKIAKRLKLNDYVDFLGYVDFKKLPDYFNMCDIFVNPTNRQNGYDLTVIEAMACGRPVVTTNIGSYPTAIKSGEDGILTKLKGAKNLANSVLMILDNEEFKEKISKNSRKKVLENFRMRKMIEDTIKVYEGVR